MNSENEGPVGDFGLDELTSWTSKWSLECNATLDELNAQFIGFSLGDQNSLEILNPSPPGPQPIDSFPQQQNVEGMPKFYGINHCCVCLENLELAYRYGTGWNHEKQCEGCGLSDQGSGWRQTQRKEDLACSICVVRNDGVQRYPEFSTYDGSNWQFPTKWDALQFATWLNDHVRSNNPHLECSVYDGTIFDDEQTKFHDVRMTAFEALREWHHLQRRFFDPVGIEHDLEVMEVYEPLREASDSFESTFYPLKWYRRVGWGSNPPYPDYAPEIVPCYHRAIVWIKADRWMYIKRKPGEQDFALFCRAYGLNAEDPTLELAWEKSRNWEIPNKKMQEFRQACLSSTRQEGKICLHDGWWCWLPRMELENPDEFAQRVKRFETPLVTRKKRVFHRGSYTDYEYTQEINETLAEFTMRFHDAPGEELRKHTPAMILDWAS